MSKASIAGVLLATGLTLSAQGQAGRQETPRSRDASVYRVSFDRRGPVAGIDAPPAFKLPFRCTSDGTSFITMVPAGGLIQPPLYAPTLLLVSVSMSGQHHTFSLDQATQQLHNVTEIDHFVSDSTVLFLIEAARENEPVTRNWTKPNGDKGEYSANNAERRRYLVFFSLDGDYKGTSEIDLGFWVQHIGVFPSGSLLAFGFDEKDHSPKLAMLKEDGTLLRFLQVHRGDVLHSLVGTADGSDKGPAVYVAPTELVRFGRSIILVQNKSSFPLLEVSEGGAIKAIRPQLPQGVTIDSVVESDQNLYVRVSGNEQGSIDEIDAESGAVLRRFELEEGAPAPSIACIHDGKLLSFAHGEGKLVPLVGTAEPSSKAAAVSP